MDPFIEGQAWETFHHELISGLLAALTSRVRPRYVVRVEERVYVEHVGEAPAEQPRDIRPDVTILEQSPGASSRDPLAPVVAVTPVVLTVPVPRQVREVFLTVRWRETMEIVTVIEVLSPVNKRRGSDGRKAYLRKREAVLQSDVHLVEIDLLRGGERLPTVEQLPPGDYYAFVCRANRRPQVEVYAWPLAAPLPSVPVPLMSADSDVVLSLAVLFDDVYSHAGYDYSLDYGLALDPPASEAEAEWIRNTVKPPR